MDPVSEAQAVVALERTSADEAVSIDRARTARFDRVVQLIEQYMTGVGIGAVAIACVLWISGNVTRDAAAAIMLVACVSFAVTATVKGVQGFRRGPTHPSGAYFLAAFVWACWAVVHIVTLST
ncbi:hypothetical protein [Glaciihabitans sp. dw_435]|uniref:hypothetical protein n=1 Tax=Glaciihabitans sp. dw_435 TaxID=2720081 RepID=UPI001BD43DFD|nr:hypothetical protein [Glaciihabitans sp. dw_435]